MSELIRQRWYLSAAMGSSHKYSMRFPVRNTLVLKDGSILSHECVRNVVEIAAGAAEDLRLWSPKVASLQGGARKSP